MKEVYVSSIAWDYCEPFLVVVGNNPKTVSSAARRVAEEEVRLISQESEEEESDLAQQIGWSEPIKMRLEDVLSVDAAAVDKDELESLLRGDEDAVIYLPR